MPKLLAKMYSPRELNIIYRSHTPASLCCFKDCGKFVAGNTEEKMCLEHWEEHLSAFCGFKF